MPLLEFCKNSQRADQVNNIDSTCFSCWDDLSYGLNTLGPLRCNVYITMLKTLFLSWDGKICDVTNDMTLA